MTTVLCNRGPFWVRLAVPATDAAAALAQANAWAAEHYDHTLRIELPPNGVPCRTVVELWPGGPVDVDLTGV